MVQDEAELVWMKAALGCLPLCVDNRRSEAVHGGVVYHHTHLMENQKDCLWLIWSERSTNQKYQL